MGDAANDTMVNDDGTRLILLIGPKGAGKSHIGAALSRLFEAKFLRIEAVWQALQKEREDFLSASYITEGIDRSLLAIERCLAGADGAVILESTAAFPGFAGFHETLRRMARVTLVRIDVPLDECRRRIEVRDHTLQVQIPEELVEQINRSAEQADLAWDLVVRNEPMVSPADLQGLFRHILDPRR